MTYRAVVRARLLRLWRDLRGAATLRRTERRLSTYLLRLASVALVLALPAWKLVQLGPLRGALALAKAGAAVAVVVAALAALFAALEWARRRRWAARRRRAAA